MKHLKFTYVDAVTKVSVATSPARNGPVFPFVVGLKYVWAMESAYPTNVPHFFGTCPDDADTDVDGVLGVFSEADWLQMQANEMVMRPSLRDVRKRERAAAVEAITVTTAAGNTFDGDEVSQGRMARAVIVLSSGAAASVPWVLTDNTVIQASATELGEALALAGAAQAALWVI